MIKLYEGLESLGLSPDKEQMEQLNCYLSELALWNKTYKLVGAEGDELLIRHVFDCLAPWPYFSFEKGLSIADVGSGAGLPGILLAIMFRQHQFTLIERMERRCRFLHNTVLLCGLEDRVEILQADLKEVKDTFDIVCFRAFRDFKKFSQQLFSIAKAHGKLYAYKGKQSQIDEDLAEHTGEYQVIPLEVPYLLEERHLLILTKGD